LTSTKHTCIFTEKSSP